MSGEAASSFESVQIVIEAGLPAAGWTRIVVHGESRAEPLDRSLQAVVVLVWTATDDMPVFDRGIARLESCRGNREPADAGTGHAAGADVAGDIAPRAVFVLRAAPVIG